MLPRKQRILLMVVIPILIVILIGLILTIVLMNTDFMKSKDVLFQKYFVQNIYSIDKVSSSEQINPYKNVMDTSNYNLSSNVTMKTSSAEDYIVNLAVRGNIERSAGFKYYDLQFKDNENKLLEVEYANQDDLHGIRFTDFFKQYVSVKSDNIKDLAKKLGVTEQFLQYIPDSIDFNNIYEGLEFSDEEKNELYKKYTQIIFNDIPTSSYSKQSKSLITVNEKSINTNAYKVVITEEEFKNLYTTLLEQIKQDEVILGKLNKIDSNISKIGINNETFSIKNIIIESLETSIQEIKNSDIKTGHMSVTVHESKGQLVRTVIEDEDNKMTIDRVSDEATEQLVIENTKKSENLQTFKTIIERHIGNGESSIKFSTEYLNSDGDKEIVQIETRNTKVDDTINQEYISKYSIGENSTEISIKNIINIGKVDNIEKLNSNNNIILNDLNQEEISRLFTTISEKISPSISQVFSETTKILPIRNSNISNNIDFNIGDENTVTDIQKNRFNSQYEIYTGNEVSSDSVKSMLNVLSENLLGIDVVDGKTLIINVEKNKQNKELAERILNVIQDGATYKVEIKYNNENGLVSNIILTKNVKQ